MTDAWESKPKIGIAIPYGSKWELEWVEMTYRFLRCIPVNWCDKLIFYSKAPSLPLARDSLVRQALDGNCDYIFFIDTDVIFESPQDPNLALNALYQCMINNPDSKIVSGLYRAKQQQGFSNAIWMKVIAKDEQGNNKVGFSPIERWTGNWITCDVTGLGCCLIDMEVFKSVKQPWFHWEIIGDISEDFYFFMKAKEQGYKLNIFTDVRLSHIGTIKVKSDGTFCLPML